MNDWKEYLYDFLFGLLGILFIIVFLVIMLCLILALLGLFIAFPFIMVTISVIIGATILGKALNPLRP